MRCRIARPEYCKATRSKVFAQPEFCRSGGTAMKNSRPATAKAMPKPAKVRRVLGTPPPAGTAAPPDRTGSERRKRRTPREESEDSRVCRGVPARKKRSAEGPRRQERSTLVCRASWRPSASQDQRRQDRRQGRHREEKEIGEFQEFNSGPKQGVAQRRLRQTFSDVSPGPSRWSAQTSISRNTI